MKAIQKTKSKKSLSERVTAMEGDPRGALATWGRRMAGRTRSIFIVLRHGILSLYSYIRKFVPWRSRTSSPFTTHSLSTHIRNVRLMRISGVASSFLLGLLALATLVPLYNVVGTEDTEAATEDCANSGNSSLGTNCSITFTSTRNTATAEITPTANPVTNTDNFASSIPNTTDAAFSIGTNNAQGYDLKISSSAGTTLKPSTTATTDEAITALTTSTGITKESTSFTNNTWGYLPSYYNSTANTDKYYPITTSTTTLRITTSANPTNTYDDYTIGIGAKVDMSRTAGTYTLSGNTSNPGSITLSYVANPTGYEITYADNSGDSTVSNMPTTTQSGAVSATSIALAPNRTPTRTGYSLTGWCLGEVTNSGTTCSGTTIATNGSLALDRTATSNKATLYAIWTPNQYSCRKYYRLQNADGSFPNSYTADGSELVSYNDTCTYSKSYNYYKGSANGTNNEQVTKTATMNSTNGIDIYMDLYRNTYSLTVSAGSNTSSATGSGTYRWGQTVAVGVTASSNTTCLTYSTPTWSQSGTTGTFSSTSGASTNFTMGKGNSSLTASSNSTRGTYTISYNANGGSGTTMSNTTASCGSSTALRTNTYTRTGYTFLGWSTSSTATSASYTNSINLSRTSDLILYAVWSADPVTYSATIYYNASSTNGGTDIRSTTISCDTVTDSSCSPTIPDAVKNSVGTYNNAYAGLADRTDTMSASTSLTLNSSTNGKTYYSVYRSSIKIYTPSSTSALTSSTRYRNQWFTDNSTPTLSTTVLSDSDTGTRNFTQTATVSTDYNFIGFSTSSSNNSTSYSSVSSLAATNRTSNTYAVYGRSYTATFYYNNHTSCSSGTSSVTSTPKTAIQYLRPTGTSSSSVGLSNSDYSTPTGSLGTYCNALVGWATSTGTMTTTTPQTPTTTYYAVYRTNVTNYYYTGSAYSSRTLYRNQTLSSTTAMGTTYLSTADNTLSDVGTSTGPGTTAASFAGFSTSLTTNSTTVAYNNVTAAKQSTATTLNTVYQFNISYSTAGSTGVSSIDSTSGSCKISSTSSTAGGTSCSVTLPSISTNTGYSSLGWGSQGHTGSGTAANSSYTLSTNSTTLYANAKINTYSLAITFAGTGVSSVQIRTGSGTSGSLAGTVSTSGGSVSGLVYNTTYYLYPVFSSGYELSSWASTGSYGTLSSTTATNPTFKMGAGDGAVTITGKSSIISLGYMQDLTLDACKVATTSGYGATDKRDGKVYSVRYINDYCWMTQNLRYLGDTGSSSGTMTIGNSNSNVSNKSITLYSLNSSNAGNFGAYSSHCDSTNGYNYACVYDSGSTTTGVWYNYYAASAGTISTSSNNTAATKDICPAGWHLPTGPNTTSGTDINKLVGNTTSDWQSATAGLTAFSAVAGGNYNNGSLSDTGNGYWWSATAGSTTGRYRLYYNSSDSTFNGSGYYNRYRGYFVRCVMTPPPTMQSIAVSDLAEGEQVTAIDARDGKDYTIKKINGYLWMTQNLRYLGDTGSATGTMTIGNNNSNASNTSEPITLYSLNSSNAGSFGAYSSHCDSTNGYNYACVYDSGSTTTGVWYNYYAATAGTISTNSNSTAATKDICPAGWHLPTGPNTTSGTDINKLVGNTTSGWQSATTGLTAFSAVAGGSYYDGSLRNTGRGNWWSATAYDTTTRYYLLYDSSNSTFNGNNFHSYRYVGYFVRCVRTS